MMMMMMIIIGNSGKSIHTWRKELNRKKVCLFNESDDISLSIHTRIDETETHQELLFNTSSDEKKYVININMSFCSSSIVIRK